MPTNPAILHPPGHDAQNVLYWDPRLETFVAITRDREGKIADVRPELLASAEGVAAYRRHWRADPGPKSHRRVGQCEATARDLKVSDAAKGVLQSEKTRAESELVELRSSNRLLVTNICVSDHAL